LLVVDRAWLYSGALQSRSYFGGVGNNIGPTQPSNPIRQQIMMEAFLTLYLSNPWYCYGIGPVLFAAFGFLVPWAFLVFLEKAGLTSIDEQGYTYTSKTESRTQDIAKSRSTYDYSTQLIGSLKTVLGPGALLNVCLSALLLPYLFHTPLDQLPLLPSLKAFIVHFILAHVINDFFLYWGHRIQHENKWLWENFHSVHHRIATPTAVSTAYIDPIDMTLQSSLPTLLAMVLTQSHPVTFAIFAFSRVAENTFNHCGLDSTLINVVSLKFLPFRAAIKHHDEHHKFSGYSGNAKNYGEGFWIWDSMFGTSRQSTTKNKKM